MSGLYSLKYQGLACICPQAPGGATMHGGGGGGGGGGGFGGNVALTRTVNWHLLRV